MEKIRKLKARTPIQAKEKYRRPMVEYFPMRLPPRYPVME
jgi:hypothetical protein